VVKYFGRFYIKINAHGSHNLCTSEKDSRDTKFQPLHVIIMMMMMISIIIIIIVLVYVLLSFSLERAVLDRAKLS